MSSSRKKQDEKNLKTLRELGSLPQNKYCFDCNERGPTYVDVTIGSFVCTKCSGMLRGLTPPHRVKSISMATFTPEEVELVRSHGNEYCRRTWLGLYEGTPPNHSDEQAVRDHMVDIYERKRYYLDPNLNGHKSQVKPLTHLVSDAKPLRLNGNANFNGTPLSVPPPSSQRTRPEARKGNDFVADFEKADIFTANDTTNGFADFDNNPVFSEPGKPAAQTNNLNTWTQQQNLLKGPPKEDKYAALKDLDNALKSQTALDWSSSGSNGSLYSSPTPTGSLYSSSSPQNSIFGSPPSQGNFMNNFQPETNGVSNPFVWGNAQQSFANPFRTVEKGFQNQSFGALNGNSWTANPFKVEATATNSHNPFL